MTKFCLLTFSILFICPYCLFGQEKNAKYIPEVVVESNRSFFSDDHTTRTFDMKELPRGVHENIGSILERNSPVMVRNYGANGSLASLSLHGTGSNHTQVSWNGIPLNSPTTGQIDLSLIPSMFMQSVEIINGASGSLFGSGTFGGSVNLSNKVDWNNRFLCQYYITGGSYGSMSHMFNMVAGSNRIQYQLSAVTSRADNDFYYRDDYRYGSPKVKNNHNFYQSTGFIQNINVKLNRFQLDAGMWYQHKLLEVPPLMGSYETSEAKQRDSIFRSFVSFKKKGQTLSFMIRSAYFSDFIHYTDKANAIDSGYSLNSKINGKRWMNDADLNIFILPELIGGLGISYNRIHGNSNNYGGIINENEVAFFSNVKFIHKDLIVNAGFRKEFYEELNPDPQYSLGARYQLNKNIMVRSSVSTKFRKPTFNEKYWKPGGNPNLRPEKGIGGELTADIKIFTNTSESYTLRGRITGFYQTVDNWIQWVIADSLTPVEYKKVHTGGLESWLDYEIRFGELLWKGSISYNFNHTLIKETFDNNKASEGNQLAYVPKHTFRVAVDLNYHGFILGAYGSYIGKRETADTENSFFRMPSYTVVNLNTGWQKNLKDWNFSVLFHISNVFDKPYQVIRSYAIPGRSYYVTLIMGFNKKNPQN